MTYARRALFELHIAVLLFGISGVFGKLLPIDPSQIVFGRSIIGFVALLLILMLKGQLRGAANTRQWLINITLGALLSFHWITFFKAIQVSSVAVGLLAFASFPVFVTLMEPFFFKEHLRWVDILTMGAVVLGLYLVVPPLGTAHHIMAGISWGVFSAFLFAVLSLCNRSRLKETKPLVLSLYQNMGAAMTAGLIMPWSGWADLTTQWSMLLLLGLVCTTLPLVLLLNSLRVLKAQLVSLVVCLEPVYGVLLAMLLLSEIPSLTTIVGGSIILGAVAVGSLLKDSPVLPPTQNDLKSPV